jgi:hypothetical protein
MATPKAPKAPYVAVDLWTLRCLYNKSNYAARIANWEFVELFRWQSKVRRNGNRTVQVYYGPTTGELMLILQWFEDDKGLILASGLRDPKQFVSLDPTIDYHQHGGNRWWEKVRRAPESLLGEGDANTWVGRLVISLQRAYGSWRRWKCERFGPVETYRHRVRFWVLGQFGA